MHHDFAKVPEIVVKWGTMLNTSYTRATFEASTSAHCWVRGVRCESLLGIINTT